MTQEEHSDLWFNRQFILSHHRLDKLKNWNVTPVGNLWLHSHPNLELTLAKNNDRTVLMLGFVFDSAHPEKTNGQILAQLAEDSFDSMLTNSFQYAGRFIILYFSNDEWKLFHDAAGLREVFYAFHGEEVWVASQPNLIETFAELENHADKECREFYNSQQFLNRKERIGATTSHSLISHLPPNHLLDLKKQARKRYFPQAPIVPISLGEAVDKAAEYLKGFLKAASLRSGLMVAVTGGWDSRVMVAASIELAGIYYFILKHEHLTEGSLDIRAPRNLFKKLGKNFDIVSYKKELDHETATLFENNVPLGNQALYPALYHEFYKKHANKLNITFVSEAARNYFHYQATPENITGKTLARLNKFEGFPFVEKQYDDWIRANKKVFEANGYNILDMFYWEEKMGNWLANGRSSMANAIEDFSPFNCKNLMALFLSVDGKYRDRYNPILHRKIIEKLSKDVLAVPINGSLKYRVIKWLVVLKIYPLYKKIQLALAKN